MTKIVLHKLSRFELEGLCYGLRAENLRLQEALEKAEKKACEYVDQMVQQAEASDSMKLGLILSGLLISPAELPKPAARLDPHG
jgi:hypothetical protein